MIPRLVFKRRKKPSRARPRFLRFESIDKARARVDAEVNYWGHRYYRLSLASLRAKRKRESPQLERTRAKPEEAGINFQRALAEYEKVYSRKK